MNNRKPQASNFFSQLSIFDQMGLQMATQAVANELFSPQNLALGGLVDALPSTKSYFQIRPSTVLVPPGKKGKLTANLNAIKTAKAIIAGGRKATGAEQAVMAQYTGWGGMSSFWDKAAYVAVDVAQELSKPVDSYYEGWAKTYGASRLEVATYLSAEEIEQAGESTVNAFYTSRAVCDAMWKAITGFGFTGGNILEPAAGIGHFVGLMPGSIRDQSTITAVEKDGLSAQILSVLYPELTVMNSGFEDCALENGTFDLVVGNVPFGDFKVYDSKNRDLSDYNIHNYFIGRSARLLREGGLMALITSAGTMDAQSKLFRQQLINEGVELVGAVRLPSSAFEECAGTEVTTDILFFQKKTENIRRFSQHTFLQTVTVRTIEPLEEHGEIQTIRINEYFSTRPEMMIGEMYLSGEIGKGGLYRDDRQTLFLDKNEDFTSLLSKAVDELPTAIFKAISRNPLAGCLNRAVSRLAAFSSAVRCKGRSFIQSVVTGLSYKTSCFVMN